jgi:hypothetical protein
MKRAIACLLALMFVAALTGMSQAAEAEEVYVEGKVIAYEAGKSISVKNEEGKNHDFTITGDTEIDGKPAIGAAVEVEAEGSVAVYIEVMEKEEGEE